MLEVASRRERAIPQRARLFRLSRPAVSVLGGVVSVLCRHAWLTDGLAERHGNHPTLGDILGIRRVADIPKPGNRSRFLDRLGQPRHLQALRDIFDRLGQGPRRGRARPG